jgi:hypothetical protein
MDSPALQDAPRRTARAGNELLWWASKGVDPFGLALALHHATGDDDMADGFVIVFVLMGAT